VSCEIERQKGGWRTEAVHAAPLHSLRLPFLPLEKVLAVRESLLHASPEIEHLVELHIAAHKSELGALFFLAKGLELAGAFFGRRRTARNTGLERELKAIGIAARLTRSVEWLFEIANTRFDVRHAVKPCSPVSLHPRMNDSERAEFRHNADLLLRGFICARLGVGIVTLNRANK
jgi:hypothetical protein